jgi:dipeptidyl aminopeptidase/acylaminoacyl peptidase
VRDLCVREKIIVMLIRSVRHIGALVLLLALSACVPVNPAARAAPATIDARENLPTRPPATQTPTPQPTATLTAVPTRAPTATPVPRRQVIAYEKSGDDQAGFLWLMTSTGQPIDRYRLSTAGWLGQKIPAPDGYTLLFTQPTGDQNFFFHIARAELPRKSGASPDTGILNFRGKTLGSQFLIYPSGWLDEGSSFLAMLPNIRLIKVDLGKSSDTAISTLGPETFQPLFFAAVSPDQRQIAAFGTDVRTGSKGLFVLDIDTGDLTQVAEIVSPNFSALHASWSPDGSQLVFSDYAKGQTPQQYDIFVVGSDGQNLKQITKTPEEERQPVWSRTGDLIAFELESPGRSDLGVIDSDGSNWRNLSKTPDLACSSPEWAPLERVILVTCGEATAVDIYVVDPARETFTNLTNDGASRDPVWLVQEAR